MIDPSGHHHTQSGTNLGAGTCQHRIWEQKDQTPYQYYDASLNSQIYGTTAVGVLLWAYPSMRIALILLHRYRLV